MIIRKLFKFENAHIVRNCSSERCSQSLHGHSYKVEILLEAQALDYGQMVYDFGLMKADIRTLLDSFDHALTLWSCDDPAYLEAGKQFSARWIELPVSPSAEQFARVFFVLVERVLNLTNMQNGEKGVQVHSVIVHETETGYAQAFKHDIDNPQMGAIPLASIVFSDAIQKEWPDSRVFARLKAGEFKENPKPVHQVNSSLF